mmetsp:Transcript_49657/g.91689  ORF Transcript_49657/g.91689 Transcript_49657/m.91689 type:complete len:437 (+) Transcript_49657:122-1432(+)
MVKVADKLLPVTLEHLKKEMGPLQEDSAAETTDAGSDTESVSTNTSSCAGDSAPIMSWRVVGSNRAVRQVPTQSVTNPMRRRPRFSGTPLQPIPASPCGEESVSPKKRLGASLSAVSPQISRSVASPSRRSRLGRVSETQVELPAAVQEPPATCTQAPEVVVSSKLSKRKRRQKQTKSEDSLQKQANPRGATSGRPDKLRNITPAPASARPLPVGPVRAQITPESSVPPLPPQLPQPIRLPPGLEAVGPMPKQDPRAFGNTSIMATAPVAPTAFPPCLPARPAPLTPPLSFPPCPPPAYPPSQAGGRACKGVLSTDPLPMQPPSRPSSVAPVPPPQQDTAAADISQAREGIMAQARRDGLPLKVREPMQGALAAPTHLLKDLPAKKRPVYDDAAGQASKVPLDPNLPLKLRISDYLFEETQLHFDVPATWAKPSSR